MKFLISAFLSVTSLTLLAQSREVYIYEDSLTIEVLRIGCQSECTGQLGDNIFPNGDFGSGTPNILPVNPGIAPDIFTPPIRHRTTGAIPSPTIQLHGDLSPATGSIFRTTDQNPMAI
jgi:hypothetical protein